MEVIGEFLNFVFDQEEEKVTEEKQTAWEETITENRVLQLKGNIIPYGLVPLERLLKSNDVASKPVEQGVDEQVEDCNIGSKNESRMIKLSKGIPYQYKQRYLDLFRTYKYVFSWSYDYLKTFDTNFIQHKIPLKNGMKPCKKKLKQINPLLLPSIEKE